MAPGIDNRRLHKERSDRGRRSLLSFGRATWGRDAPAAACDQDPADNAPVAPITPMTTTNTTDKTKTARKSLRHFMLFLRSAAGLPLGEAPGFAPPPHDGFAFLVETSASAALIGIDGLVL
jgi:hypothetical protein